MKRIKPTRITARNAFNKSSYGAVWEQVKKELPLNDARCSRCGSQKKLQRHHLIPVGKSGSRAIANIEIVCQSCHALYHPHLRDQVKKIRTGRKRRF